tara:strand:- start:1147 stop:1362 length:216 start_codon:yes stop_codon:yes gene_type:complete
MSEIIFSRHTTPLIILKDGSEIGRIFRGRGFFGLELKGVYWRHDRQRGIGGRSCLGFKRLCDAKAFAVEEA